MEKLNVNCNKNIWNVNHMKITLKILNCSRRVELIKMVYHN